LKTPRRKCKKRENAAINIAVQYNWNDAPFSDWVEATTITAAKLVQGLVPGNLKDLVS
jgi:hypothetical protein